VSPQNSEKRIIAIILSADSEWKAILKIIKPNQSIIKQSPFGEWFPSPDKILPFYEQKIIFIQGGWGKINAAASTQWTINYFNPTLIINIGTAGGFKDSVNFCDILYASKTIVYDIFERMGSEKEAIEYYSTHLGLPPSNIANLIIPATLISADKDIDPMEIHYLMLKYQAIAADWESGSIAHVCKLNKIPVHILRGISDVVNTDGSNAYGNVEEFHKQSEIIINKILLIIEKLL
jgi:adenosylhomocysteine nucleosidase